MDKLNTTKEQQEELAKFGGLVFLLADDYEIFKQGGKSVFDWSNATFERLLSQLPLLREKE